MALWNNRGEEPTAKDSFIQENLHTINALKEKILEMHQEHTKELSELRELIRNLRLSIDDFQREKVSDMLKEEETKFNPNRAYDGIQKI